MLSVTMEFTLEKNMGEEHGRQNDFEMANANTESSSSPRRIVSDPQI